MSRDKILDRPREESPPERDSFWDLPRATAKLVVLAAETQDGIERGLSPVGCFESNRQYWRYVHDQVRFLVSRRSDDGHFRRLPDNDRNLLNELDDIKLDFCGAMIATWRLDKDASLPALISQVKEPARPYSPERPWSSPSVDDVASRRQHRFNLTTATDFDHLWADWLVSSGRVHPLQIGPEGHKLQIAELQDATDQTKGLLDTMSSREHLDIIGPGETLIKKQLECLNSATTRARAAYIRVQQTV